jgi:hypothetical protein
MKGLKDELTLDLFKESARIDALFTIMNSMQSRLDTLENCSSRPMDEMEVNGTQQGSTQNGSTSLSYPDVTITASGIPVTEGEDLIIKVTSIINELGIDAHAVAATRLPARINTKPPIVKFSVRNLKEKVTILRNKYKLKDHDTYKSVYLKSSKSHAERLIELNARTILRNIPNGNMYRVDANGRIKPRAQDNTSQQ